MTTMRPGLAFAAILALIVGACDGSAARGTDPGAHQPGTSAGPTAQASPTSTPAAAATPLPGGVLASIALHPGSAPTAIFSAYDSIWVESHRGTQLYRIDPNTDRIIATIDVGQESCGTPGVGAGRVWVMPCGDGTKTMVVDPTTDQVVGSFAGGSVQMAFAAGSAWTTTPSTRDGTYQRLDPATFQLVSTTHVGTNPFESVVVGQFIDVLDVDPMTGVSSGQISKFDPLTSRVVATISTPDLGTSPWLTYAFGSLWLKSFDDARLVKVDPDTGRATTDTIAGFQGMSQFYDAVPVEGLGSLWMRIADGTVARIDPGDGKVLATYPADTAGGGGYVTVAFGSLWVANFASDTVWRVRIQGQ